MLNLTTMSSSNAPAVASEIAALKHASNASSVPEYYALHNPEKTFDTLTAAEQQQWVSQMIQNLGSTVAARNEAATAAAIDASTVIAEQLDNVQSTLAPAPAQAQAQAQAQAPAPAQARAGAGANRQTKSKSRVYVRQADVVAAKVAEQVKAHNEQYAREREESNKDRAHKCARIKQLEEENASLKADRAAFMSQHTSLCQTLVRVTASLPPWSGAQQNM